jgi:hypothetical protein
VLPDVAQELQRGEALGPVQIVDGDGGVRSVEVVEPVQLLANSTHPTVHHFARVERALTGHLRITDQPCRSADQREGSMPVLLEAPYREHLDEVAKVKAWRGGVEAAVQRDGSRLGRRPQGAEIGALRDEPAPCQFVDDGGHDDILPHARGSSPSARHVADARNP